MPAVPDHLVLLHVLRSRNRVFEDLLYDLSRHQGPTDWSVIPQVFLLPFLKHEHCTCPVPVICGLTWQPWVFMGKMQAVAYGQAVPLLHRKSSASLLCHCVIRFIKQDPSIHQCSMSHQTGPLCSLAEACKIVSIFLPLRIPVTVLCWQLLVTGPDPY